MQEYIDEIRSLVLQTVRDSKATSIALSGGLDSSILASCLREKKITAITLIAKDFVSTDLIYAQLVANLCHLKLEVITANVEELLEATEETIKILKVFNPIEIRNNVVIYLTMKRAKDLGHNSIMTGDGADELFAGYNFFKRMSGKELDEDLKRIWRVMHYPSRKISEYLGISLYTPFLDKRFSDYAKEIPSALKIHDENGILYGKWILRKAFEDSLPSSIVWREKYAMQDGAGTCGISGFIDSIISDSVFVQKAKLYKDKDRVNLRSKESLYYYESYVKNFEPPYLSGDSTKRCPECNYALESDSHFCRMCGTYPI